MTEQKQTVLIVEDDDKNLDILDIALSRNGYRILKARDGRCAINIAEADKPDMVILDLNLPDCNGMDILGRIKMLNEAAQVIIITGYGSQDTVRKAMELGAFDFLTKPFDLHGLCALVKEAFASGT